MPSDTDHGVPPVSNWLQNGFHRFLNFYLRRHFHTIAIDRESRCDADIDPDLPLIVYGNHPSWWDPLLAHYLNRVLFPQRQFYAPIDAVAIQQYKVFAKLGFYGVEMNAKSGAVSFLKQSTAILNAGDTAIWMTPEGRFADVRDHTATLMPGLAHLCSKMDRGYVMPIVLEYSFWEERLPECLVRMGPPVDVSQAFTKTEWADKLETQLRSTQTELARQVTERNAVPFQNLLSGKRGAGGLYDFFRRAKSLVTGKRFRASHGDKFE